MQPRSIKIILPALLLAVCCQWVPLAAAQPIQPVPPDVALGSPLADAVQYLKVQGIMRGYDDGMFRPLQRVTRAEAIKTVVGSVTPADEMTLYAGVSAYDDVDPNVWYAPYVEAARADLHIIDGPPASAVFRGAAPVQLAEFLKLLLLAQDVDVQGSYAEIRSPLAIDIPDAEAWFYPYMRYGVTTSMLFPDPRGALLPGRELTRGDMALLLYHFLMYREGRRTQALLALEETDLIATLRFLEQKDIALAEQASARAILAARGAHAKRSDLPLVQAAVKVAEGFRSLIVAYRAGLEGRMADAVAAAKEAWILADRAYQLDPELEKLSVQLKTIAQSMAEQGRAANQ
jgi:hypothetical protein